MKFGVRKPSLKRSIKARTTGRIKRSIKKTIPLYGKKGMGWIKNPKKAAYNKVYRKTTVGVLPSVVGVGKQSKKRTASNAVSTTTTRIMTEDGVLRENARTKRKTWRLVVAVICLIGGLGNIGRNTGVSIIGIVLALAFGAFWYLPKIKHSDEHALSEEAIYQPVPESDATDNGPTSKADDQDDGAAPAETHFCPHCGHEVADGNKFCGNCGNKIETSGFKVE